MAWRQPAFLQDAARCASVPQMSRLKKMYHEPFFLIDATTRTTGAPGTSVASVSVTSSSSSCSQVRFSVSGSAATVYTVVLKSSNGHMTCSCKDAILTCRRVRCACKHVCFVAFRVLRQPSAADLLSASVMNAMPQPGLTLSPAVVSDVLQQMADGTLLSGVSQEERRASSAMTEHDVNMLCGARTMFRGGAVASTADFTTVRRTPVPDEDECPVCYDVLVRGAGHGHGIYMEGAELRGCPDCGRGVHLACVMKWLQHAPAPTCVMCRSRVWSQFNRS